MWGTLPSGVPMSIAGWGIVPGFGPGAPPDSYGALGDYYYDTTADRWYLKRWVGNFSGVDAIRNADVYFGATAQFTVEFLVNSAAGAMLYPTLVTNNTVIAGTIAIQGNESSSNIALVQPTVGSFLTNPTPVLDGKWHKVSCSRDSGGTYSIAIDNGAASTATPALSGAPASLSVGAFVSGVAQQFVGKMANLKIAGYGRSLIWGIDDGSGITVHDSSGNGNDGTLTDGTPTNFWYQAWVPADLLGTEANFSSPTNSALFVNLFN